MKIARIFSDIFSNSYLGGLGVDLLNLKRVFITNIFLLGIIIFAPLYMEWYIIIGMVVVNILITTYGFSRLKFDIASYGYRYALKVQKVLMGINLLYFIIIGLYLTYFKY